MRPRHTQRSAIDVPIDRNYILDLLKPKRPLTGFDRGLPIDRYYIDRYLLTCKKDIQGHVLEIGEDIYTCRLGGQHVTKSDVLHVTNGNPAATIVADLTSKDSIPANTFDCVIATQTFQYIYDIRAAVKTLHRILKPSGVVLASFPGIAQISRYDMEHWGEYWRFTTMSIKRLFESIFIPDNIEVHSYGNMLTAIAFLLGLPAEELTDKELNYCHPDFQVLLTARAVK